MNFIQSYNVSASNLVKINFPVPALKIAYIQTSANNLYISALDNENTNFNLPNSRNMINHLKFTTGVRSITITNSGEGTAVISIGVEEWGN